MNVESFEVDPEISELLRRRLEELAPETLVLLPKRLAAPGGHYLDILLVVPKELRARGVPADFLHPQQERTGLSEFAADPDAIVAFAFGVLQNMTWDTAKLAFTYWTDFARRVTGRSDPTMKIRIAQLRTDAVSIKGLEITARPSDVTEVLRILTGRDEPN